MDFNFNDNNDQQSNGPTQEELQERYNRVMHLNYMDMYQMALKFHLGGWNSWWPVPSIAKKHFKLIQDRLMSDREEPVFCFLARIDRNTFETMSLPANQPMQNNSYPQGNDNNGMQQSRKPGFFKTLWNWCFGWLTTPFSANQMWAAFVLTNTNKLYLAHYAWPIPWASKSASLILSPKDMRVDIVTDISNPYYGHLTLMSLRGNQNLSITWKQNMLHKIKIGIDNNIQNNSQTVEDEDHNVMP